MKGDKTVNELARLHGVNPRMGHARKKQLVSNAEKVFQSDAKTDSVEHEAWQAQFYEQIVRRIFDRFEEPGSTGSATRKLKDLGTRHPMFTTRSEKVRGGKLFTKQKVIEILRNRVYLGEIHGGKSEQADCHASIISLIQFDRVQHRLGQTAKRRHNLKK